MKFRVGQRVKKVRGACNVGYEGVVVGYMNHKRIDGLVSDIAVKYERSWISLIGTMHPPSSIAPGASAHYEPIQDRPELSTWAAIRELGIDVHAGVTA